MSIIENLDFFEKQAHYPRRQIVSTSSSRRLAVSIGAANIIYLGAVFNSAPIIAAYSGAECVDSSVFKCSSSRRDTRDVPLLIKEPQSDKKRELHGRVYVYVYP
uniref:Uncharacterized protein n=1 Tax=Trichogramma kaykai TaxID=54128 RepID=A0ABD2XP58_9HYME